MIQTECISLELPIIRPYLALWRYSEANLKLVSLTTLQMFEDDYESLSYYVKYAHFSILFLVGCF